MKLNIEVIGDGEPIALIHGFGFNRSCFKTIVNQLSQHYQCHLIDLPGFGNSDYQPYTLQQLIDNLHLRLPKPLKLLLGWSLGGSIAIAYAKKFSSSVDSLCLVATNPLFIENKSSPWPGMQQPLFDEFFSLCQNNLTKALNNFLLLQFAKNRIDRSLLKSLKRLQNNPLLTTDAAINALKILAEHDLRQSYQQLSVPVLNILGELDQLVPVDVTKKLLMYGSAKQQIKTLANSAHLPFMTDATLFMQLLDEFMTRYSAISID